MRKSALGGSDSIQKLRILGGIIKPFATRRFGRSEPGPPLVAADTAAPPVPDHKKDGYYKAQFNRLHGRLGAQKAI